MDAFSKASDNAATATGKHGGAAGQTAGEQEKLNKKVREGNDSFKTMVDRVKQLVIGFSALQLARRVDDFQVLRDRITTATRSMGEFILVEADLRRTAAATGSALESNVALFQRIAGSAQDIGASTPDILTFNRAIQQLGVIGGTALQNIRFGTVQLAQAMSGTIVRAEEFNSLVENMPEVVSRIAEGLDTTPGKLRLAIVEGKVLSKDVFHAILGQTEAIGKEFEKMPPRMQRSAAAMATSFLAALSEIDNATGLTGGIAVGFQTIAENMDLVIASGTALTGLALPLVLKSIAGAMDLVTASSLRLATVIARHPLVFFATVIAAAATSLYAFRNAEVEVLGVTATLGEVVQATVDVTKDWFNNLVDVEAVIETVKTKLPLVGDAIKSAFMTGIDLLSDFTNFAAGMWDTLINAAQAAGQIVVGVFQASWQAAKLLAERAGDLFGALITDLKNFDTGFTATGAELAKDFSTGFAEAMDNLDAEVGETMSQSLIGDAVGSMVDGGKEAVDAFIGAVADRAGNLAGDRELQQARGAMGVIIEAILGGGLGDPGGGTSGGIATKTAALDKFVERLGDAVALAKREVELLGATSRERAVELELVKASALARKDFNDGLRESADLTAQEIALIREKAGALFDSEQIIADTEAATELWSQIWENAFENIQNAFAGSIRRMLDGSVDSFRDFGREILNIMKDVAAQIATAMIIRPVLGGIAGGVGLDIPGLASGASGGGNSLLTTGASSAVGAVGGSFWTGAGGTGIFGPGAGSVSLAGGALLGAGIGAIGGSFVGDALGIDRTGSAIGGGAGGALAGFMIAAGGNPLLAVGFALASSIVGGLIGDLFSGKPSDKLQGGSIDLASGDVGSFGFEGKKFSQGNRDASDTFIDFVSAFTSGLTSTTGGRIAPFSGNSSEIAIQQGDNSGITVSFGTALSETFDTMKEAVAFTVDKIVSNLRDIPDDFKTAIDNLDFNENFEDAFADLEFLQSFLAIEQSIKDSFGPQSTVADAIRDISDQFEGMGERLADLGLEASRATDLFDMAIGQLRTNLGRAFNERLNAANGRGFLNDINAAAAQFEIDQADAAAVNMNTEVPAAILFHTVSTIIRDALAGMTSEGEARDEVDRIKDTFRNFPDIVAAADIVLNDFITTLSAANDNDANAQALADTIAATNNVTTLFNALLQDRVRSIQTEISAYERIIQRSTQFAVALTRAADELSIDPRRGSATERLPIAQRLFEDTLAAARGGDETATAQLTEVGRQFLDVAEDTYGSTVEFQTIAQQVEDAFREIAGNNIDAVSVALDQLDVLNGILAALTGGGQGGGGGPANDNNGPVTTAADLKAAGLLFEDEKAKFIAGGGTLEQFLTSDLVRNVFIPMRDDLISRIIDPALIQGGVDSAKILQDRDFHGELAAGQLAASLARGKELGLPGYAAGGDHAGGLRIVGEQGMELEATGASRIFSAEQTRGIVGGAMLDSHDVLDRLDTLVELESRLVKESVKQRVAIEGLTKRIADLEAENKELRLQRRAA